MQNKKVDLKKVNRTNSSTVRTLDCHCGCEGRPGQAFMKGYVGSFIYHDSQFRWKRYKSPVC